MPKDKEVAGAGIGLVVILAIAAAINLAKAVFHFLVFAAALCFLAAIILTVLTLCLDWDRELACYCWIGTIVFVLLSVVAFFIGFGLGDSSVGQAILSIHAAVFFAEDAEKNATIQTIDALQTATSQLMSDLPASTVPGLEKATNSSFELLKTGAQIS